MFFLAYRCSYVSYVFGCRDFFLMEKLDIFMESFFFVPGFKWFYLVLFGYTHTHNYVWQARINRHAAYAAKALRWRVDQLLKCLIKKITLSSQWCTYV